MPRTALNIRVESEQKLRLERLAARRKVSQATIVREAVQEYMDRHEAVPAARGAKAIWHRLTGGYYSGDGRRNRHDDIYM
jgi:predicted DNA-binding protein